MRANHLFVAITVTCFSAAGWPQSSRAPVAAAQVSTLPNGMEVSRGELHEEITALRDDVLRIRLWRGDAPPEDASWAVLASAHDASSGGASPRHRRILKTSSRSAVISSCSSPRLTSIPFGRVDTWAAATGAREDCGHPAAEKQVTVIATNKWLARMSTLPV